MTATTTKAMIVILAVVLFAIVLGASWTDRASAASWTDRAAMGYFDGS
jgi:hypothetical protein